MEAGIQPRSARSQHGQHEQPTPSASLLTLERTQALWQRMQTVDMLSLTNRLKRSGIRSADIAHLSCSTVAGILADVGKQLRNASVQDEELCAGRRNVLTLLGMRRETFGTLREMRVLLTKVVLDPGSAARVSEATMDPVKCHRYFFKLEILGNFTYETLQMRSSVNYQ